MKKASDFNRIGVLTVCAVLFLCFGTVSAQSELTRAQAIAQVRTILRNSYSKCSIEKIRGVAAVRVKAGWRVTAQITLSKGSDRPYDETLIWIVSRRNGAAAQNQLTSEVGNGCP